MPNVHGVKHEMKYSYGTFEIPMAEEDRDRPSRQNYYKSWVYRTQLSTSKLFIISLTIDNIRILYIIVAYTIYYSIRILSMASRSQTFLLRALIN